MALVRFIVVSVTALMLIAACGGAAAPQTSAPTRAPSAAATDAVATDPPVVGQPTPGTSLTACELVTAADIEAALELDAGTVEEGEWRDSATVLDPAANDCRYAGDWGGLVVAATPTDGVYVFDAVESTFGDEAEDLGLGDGALWFEDDDRGYFLKGPVMVRLQFTHLTSGDFDSFRDPTVVLGEAALGRV
jgi:hypothetical protein